jgi:hypothetical protein
MRASEFISEVSAITKPTDDPSDYAFGASMNTFKKYIQTAINTYNADVQKAQKILPPYKYQEEYSPEAGLEKFQGYLTKYLQDRSAGLFNASQPDFTKVLNSYFGGSITPPSTQPIPDETYVTSKLRNAVGTAISTGAKAAGRGIATGAKAAGRGIATGAKAAGRGLATGATAVGKGLKTAAGNIAGSIKNAYNNASRPQEESKYSQYESVNLFEDFKGFKFDPKKGIIANTDIEILARTLTQLWYEKRRLKTSQTGGAKSGTVRNATKDLAKHIGLDLDNPSVLQTLSNILDNPSSEAELKKRLFRNVPPIKKPTA